MKRLIPTGLLLAMSLTGLQMIPIGSGEWFFAAPSAAAQAPAGAAQKKPAAPVSPGSNQAIPSAQRTPRPPAIATPLPANIPVIEAKDIPRLKQMEGQSVILKGRVNEFRATWSDRAPNIIYLREGNEEFEIVFWPEPNAPDKNSRLSQPGTTVYAAGKVQQYRKRWQLKVDNNVYLSTLPLTPGMTPPPTNMPSPAAGAAGASAPPPPAGILWKPYNLQEIQQALAQKLPIMIYARSESLPRCHAIENTCLLHPEVAASAPGVTIFYVTVEDPSGAEVARALRIFRVPSLALFRDPQSIQTLPLSETSSRTEVASFLRSALSVPNAPAPNTQVK